jgi:hypothetical protein
MSTASVALLINNGCSPLFEASKRCISVAYATCCAAHIRTELILATSATLRPFLLRRLVLFSARFLRYLSRLLKLPCPGPSFGKY